MLQTIKPRSLGALTKPERRRDGVSFIVSALGLFDLAAPDDFMSEQALWPMVAKELPQGQMLDLAMPKPRGEILVAGRAMAPGGTPVKAMNVEVQLAAVAKRLAVFGDRFWRAGAGGVTFTEPQPFVEMPIEPSRAFGGPGHPSNPAGRGYQAGRLLAGGEPVPMPNVEDARFPLRSIDADPPPVRIGPIDLESSERRRYAGTYDAEWLEHDFPGLPQDVDPRLFMVAPQDQWIEGYFRGDEPFRVAGFSATHPEVRGRLPGMVVRAVIERTSEPAGMFEVGMRLDTVWLFPSENKGVLIYRGALPTQDIDGRDVKTILLAYERMGAEPRPAEHYVEQIRLRTDPERGVAYLLADGPLKPPVDAAELERRRAARQAHSEALAARSHEARRLFLADLAERQGIPPALVPEPGAAEPLPFLLPTPDDLASGDFDLAALLDDIDRFVTDTEAKLDDTVSNAQAIAERARASGRVAPSDLDALIESLAPGTLGAEDGIARSLEQARSAIVIPEGGDPASADAARAGLARIDSVLGEGVGPPVKEEEAEFREAAARFLKEPEGSLFAPAFAALAEARARSAEIPDPPADAPAPVASTTLEEMLSSFAVADDAPGGAKATLAGMREKADAVDAKLREMLPKLPTEPGKSALDQLLATLETPQTDGGSPRETVQRRLADTEASLATSAAEAEQGMSDIRRLSPVPTFPLEPMSPNVARRLGELIRDEVRAGRPLAGCDLAGADLAGAELAGLDLSGALLEKADLRGADLRGANCSRATFAGADLTGADLSDANLAEANISAANLSNAKLRQVRLSGVDIIKSNCAGADLSRAVLDRLQILETDFSGVLLDGAKLANVTMISCALTGAHARGADLSFWMVLTADAEGIDFTGSRLERCAFLQVTLREAQFARAQLESASFVGGCDLTRADFSEAVARSIGFNGAKLSAACFDYARMDQSSFSDADLALASFRLASLKGSSMSSATLTGTDLFGANLLGGQLRRADASGASLRHANLYTCDLSDATFEAADFSFANLGKTSFEAAIQ